MRLILALFVCFASTAISAAADKGFLDSSGTPAHQFWTDALSRKMTVKARSKSAFELTRFVLFKAKVNYKILKPPDRVVTLDLKDAPIREILLTIHQQTGWRFELRENGAVLVVAGPK